MRTALVCAAQTPFVRGGAEMLVRGLASELERRGFQVDVVAVPFHAYPPSEVVRQALAWRLLELRETSGRSPDLVIATKFPSYLVRHPRKVTWLFHQYREAYDLLGTEHSAISDSAEDAALRESVRTLDAAGLGESRGLFAISRNVAERLFRFNRLQAVPLHPPPPLAGRYRSGPYGDFLLYAGRLEKVKRPQLLLQALAASRSRPRLVLAGTGPLADELRASAARLGLADRVELPGFVSDEHLLELLSGCRAVLYAPVDEDYGYVPLEAFLSGRPVITTTDAGGPLEFVEEGRSGFVRPPEPAALGEAVDAVFGLGEARLRELGEEGRARVASISWDGVVEALAEPLA